jgi:hypothetical protein
VFDAGHRCEGNQASTKQARWTATHIIDHARHGNPLGALLFLGHLDGGFGQE